MNHTELENQGTGLRAVFDILEKAPSERLLSLTIHLGESPEDTIIHALCLIILQREAQALRKLQKLEDNPLANHLAEKWHSGGGKLDDFGAHCSLFEAKTGESLSSLARVFKILSEQRLCDPRLRDLAYKRAISCKCLNTSSLEYDNFREEARAVCGPQFAEPMCLPSDLKSESSIDPCRTMSEGKATSDIAASLDESANVNCMPSPLQNSPSEPSYPSHLEISAPTTISFQGDKAPAESSGNPILNPSIHENKTEHVPEQIHCASPQHTSTGTSRFGAEKDINIEEASMRSNESATQPLKPITQTKSSLPSATHILLPSSPALKSTHISKVDEEEDEEEEDIFYAFVILHAPEDSDVAESMKEKLEAVIGTTGATFSDDFAIPGKSALRCVEDAVNNSAFTFLLLTRNFNSQMVEMKTNIALINSINNVHKFNTVIPLLPRENCMPKEQMPITLQTLVALDERRNFERHLKKAFNKARIEKQRKIWDREQRMRRLRLEEKKMLRLCMERQLVLGATIQREQDGGDPRPQRLAPNIHIENANYIVIGNDSTMTVGVEGSAEKSGLS
ncbi:TIR domain-containing adapter molecule 1-like [Poecilia formosa]|uniref:TIR domain-containing adapter molecule 1-like n=1 Tax=Poecilia formosa TaxID=48698 RepID=A0A087XGM9_POEFO|nr:PREDICTED: TIR domain-containing adapter molecule 1-like [Poecilia formosa]XP_007567991.1 PREDICTED: TIR domain-containing adapter molecule 1-like [Poecilia formosa]